MVTAIKKLEISCKEIQVRITGGKKKKRRGFSKKISLKVAARKKIKSEIAFGEGFSLHRPGQFAPWKKE